MWPSPRGRFKFSEDSGRRMPLGKSKLPEGGSRSPAPPLGWPPSWRSPPQPASRSGGALSPPHLQIPQERCRRAGPRAEPSGREPAAKGLPASQTLLHRQRRRAPSSQTAAPGVCVCAGEVCLQEQCGQLVALAGVFGLLGGCPGMLGLPLRAPVPLPAPLCGQRGEQVGVQHPQVSLLLPPGPANQVVHVIGREGQTTY